jgi:hypothetical protein
MQNNSQKKKKEHEATVTSAFMICLFSCTRTRTCALLFFPEMERALRERN